MIQHPAAVVAKGVLDPRRGDATAILQHRVERYGIVLLGQILADRHHSGTVAEQFSKCVVMRWSPRQTSRRHAGDRRSYRTLTAVEFESVTTYKAARRVRLVKFLAPDTVPRTAIAIQFRFKITVDLCVGMEHKILADQTAGIRQSVGKPRRRGVQQNSRRAD